MVGYRLSALRGKGWIRLGMLGALAMVPLTGMEYARGVFSEGPRGIQQAAEYLAGGISTSMIIGLLAAWVAHGFAVKAKDDDEESSSSRGSGGLGRPASHAPAAPAAAHAAPAAHPKAH